MIGIAFVAGMPDATVSALKALPTAEGVDEVLVPGERNAGVAAVRQHGVPVPPKIWAQLTESAQSLGVPLPAGTSGE